MLSSDKSPQPGQQIIDIRVSIPEVADVGSFWIRGYSTHHTFGELYQECVNHAGALPARKALEGVRASRHFWMGDTMLLREQTLVALEAGSAKTGGVSREISLVLRRDFYRIQPARLLKTGTDSIYINSEAPAKEIVAQILTSEECADCFHLCSHKGRRVPHGRSLADEKIWPAWEDAPLAEFPSHARLQLRPRVSWLPYLVYVFALAAGAAVGFYLLAALLVHPPA